MHSSELTWLTETVVSVAYTAMLDLLATGDLERVSGAVNRQIATLVSPAI